MPRRSPSSSSKRTTPLGGDADVRHREPGRAFLQKEKAWRRRTASSGSAPGHRSSKPARALRGRRCWSCSKSSTRRMSRTSEEVAKDKLLADRENEDMPELMQKVGIKVEQDETFLLNLKKRNKAECQRKCAIMKREYRGVPQLQGHRDSLHGTGVSPIRREDDPQPYECPVCRGSGRVKRR